MKRLLATGLFLAAVTAPFSALAQDAPSPVDPAAIEDRVVVTGRRPDGLTLEEYTREFIAEIADPVSRNFGVARWDGEICVGVENLPPEIAQPIADRISQIALEVGLGAGQPGCRPNISVIFAADGPALASYLAEERPRLFRPWGGAGGTTQGLHALEAFKSTDAPVRWWQITMPVDEAGNVAISLPGSLYGPPTVQGSNSRITNLIRDEVWSAMIIVDASKLTGITTGQLADYLSMVALTQIDPDSDAGAYDSILNLFSSAARPARLTDWDWAYLRATYSFDQRRMPRSQRGQIVYEMMRAQEQAEAALAD